MNVSAYLFLFQFHHLKSSFSYTFQLNRSEYRRLKFSNLHLAFPTGRSLFFLFTGVNQVSVSCWTDALLMLCTVVNQIFMQHMKEIYLHFTADNWVSSIPFPQWTESHPNAFNYSCPNLLILQGVLIWQCMLVL